MSSIGIVCALISEGRCLTGKSIPVNKPVQINEQAIAIVCGLGEKNARIAAQKLLGEKVTALVSWGTAGALTENIHSGHLILADSIATSDGESFSFDTEWNKRVANKLCNTSIKIHNGIIAHTDQLLSTPECKTNLKTSTHATSQVLAVDMESIAIARIAHKEKLPCLAIRAIVDEASQGIPEAIIKSTDMYGRPALLSLLAAIIGRPYLISDLVNLGKSMKAATKTLTTVAKHKCLIY